MAQHLSLHQKNTTQVLSRNVSKENIPPAVFMKGIWDSVRKNSSQPGNCKQPSLHTISGSSAAWKDCPESPVPKGSFGLLQTKQRKPSPNSPPKSVLVSETSVGLDENRAKKVHQTGDWRDGLMETKKAGNRASIAKQHEAARQDDTINILDHLSAQKPKQLLGGGQSSPRAGTIFAHARAISTDAHGPDLQHAKGQQAENIMLLKMRLEHAQREIAKKDCEIANLKRKVLEQRSLLKGVQMVDTESVALAVENSRLQANLNRMTEIMRDGAVSSPSVLGLLYSPEDLAFVGKGDSELRDRCAGHQQPHQSRERKDIRGRSKSKDTIARPCSLLTSNWQSGGSPNSGSTLSGQAKYDFAELCQWLPKSVHSSLKLLSQSLGLTAGQEGALKQFVLGLNEQFVGKEKKALETCVLLCQKEIKSLKRELLETDVRKCKEAPVVRHKTDRMAFMEGASWILTRVRGEFKKLQVLVDTVLEDLDTSPKVLLKALVFATEGIGKMTRKLEKYRSHVDAEQSKEARESRGAKYSSIAPRTVETEGSAGEGTTAGASRKSKLLRTVPQDPKPQPWVHFDATQAEKAALSVCLDSETEDSLSF